MMNRAAHFLPPVLIFTALVLQNAAGGFPALAVLYHPLFLAGAVAVAVFLLPRRMGPEALREAASRVLVWTGWAFFVAAAWAALRSCGFAGGEWMIPAFLGLDSPLSSAWFRMLIAAAVALSAARALQSARPALRGGVVLLLLALLLMALDAAGESRAPVTAVPSRKVDHYFRPDTGELVRMPFSVEVLDFELAEPSPPWVLKARDRSNRLRLARAVLGPDSWRLPGTGTTLEALPELRRAEVRRSLKARSRDFLAPAIALREAEGGRTVWSGILFGLQMGSNSLFLPHCGLPVHYRHYDERRDCEALESTDLPWLPVVEARIAGLGRYVLRAVKGTKLAVPHSHYSLVVVEALPGDLASGEKGSAAVVLRGPKGEEKFLLGESSLSVRGKRYPNCRMIYLHPRTEGESYDFVRIFSRPDGKLARDVFRNGARVPAEEGDPFDFGGVRLEASEPVPEAAVSETIVAEPEGSPCLEVRLHRSDGSTKDVVLHPRAGSPVELPREEMFLSVEPAVGGGVKKVRLRVALPGSPGGELEITPDSPLSYRGCTVAVLDYDRVLGNYVVLSIGMRTMGILPVAALLLSFLLLAWEVEVRYVRVLSPAEEEGSAGKEDEE